MLTLLLINTPCLGSCSWSISLSMHSLRLQPTKGSIQHASSTAPKPRILCVTSGITPCTSRGSNPQILLSTDMADSLTATDMLNRVHRDTPGGHVGAKTTWYNVHKTNPGTSVSLQTVSDYVHACPVCQKARSHKRQITTRIKT